MTYEKEQMTQQQRPVWLQYIIDYCTTGNVFAKLGVVFLFFGFIFLLSYAVNSGFFPIKWRLICTGLVALVCISAARVLHIKKHKFSLALDGAGFGLAYIILFMCSPHAYNYIQADWVLCLMAGLSLVIAMIAFIQNAPSLITLAQLGGFLAPILSGFMGGNVEFLFAYYLVLNLVIAWIAWHKSWGALNFIGFLFTFILSYLWVNNDYDPQYHQLLVQMFLFSFVVLYTFISIMSELRSSVISKKYFLDKLVLWGVPVSASLIEYQLLLEQGYIHYYMSPILSKIGIHTAYALCFALYYAIVSGGLFISKVSMLRGIAKVYRSISLIFLVLAVLFVLIPYGLHLHWSFFLFAALSLLTFILAEKKHEKAFYVLSLIFSILTLISIVISGFVVSFESLWSEAYVTQDKFYHYVVNAELASSIILMINIWRTQPCDVELPLQSARNTVAVLSYITGGILSFVYLVAVNFQLWDMLVLGMLYSIIVIVNSKRQLVYIDALVYIFLGLVLLQMINFYSHLNFYLYQPDISYSISQGLQDNAFWLCISLVMGFMFWQLNKRSYLKKHIVNISLLFIAYCFLVLMVLVNINLTMFQIHYDGYYFLYITSIICLIGIALISKYILKPDSTLYNILTQKIAAIFAITTIIFTAITQFKATLPLTGFYLPLLNSTDLLSLISILLVLKWLQFQKAWILSLDIYISVLYLILAIIAVFCLSGAAVRAVQHWIVIGQQLNVVGINNLQNLAIQATLSILWGLIAFVTIIISNVKQNKMMWWSGMALLAIVIAKLLLVDMYNSNTLARIISFMSVAVLLLILGYFSPALPSSMKGKAKKD